VRSLEILQYSNHVHVQISHYFLNIATYLTNQIGSRLTAFEIVEEKMPGGTLICDSAAAALMRVSFTLYSIHAILSTSPIFVALTKSPYSRSSIYTIDQKD
jgi:hypothetical protein